MEPLNLQHAENKIRIPWVAKKIAHFFSNRRCSVLDIGCGAGFLSNALAQHGHYVTGVDLYDTTLNTARKNDVTKTVFYCPGNGYALPFSVHQFEVTCVMDLLEQVEEPFKVIKEASRVLQPGGLFFFHTLNRSWINKLFAIPNFHLHPLFIKPQELYRYLDNSSLSLSEIFGLRPAFHPNLLKFLLRKQIPSTLSFKVTPSLTAAYMGYAVKLK